jgi:aldehyde dehydrogenase (NAD+)
LCRSQTELTFPVPTGLFINNEFVPASDGNTIDLENPAYGTHLATVASARAADVDRAVEVAEKTFRDTWKDTAPETRRSLLHKLADLVDRDAAELASLEAVDAGILYRDSFGMGVPQFSENCRYFAGHADKLDGDAVSIPVGMGYTRREPFGVCAAIVPWNAPLMITGWKLAPALAAGNCLIIKTPELAPLYGQKLAQLIKEAGFPAGVVSVLCGTGNEAGARLAEHPRIWKLSFTGSPRVGRSILAASAKSNLKKVTLELGGKGPSIVFADANWKNALMWTSAGITVNNGQVCAAGSRIYVQDTIYEQFVKEFSEISREAVAGDPLLGTTTKGPLISKTQKETVMKLIKAGVDENSGKLLHGADDSSFDPKGHFVPNTAFADVKADATIMREEIFGPVASIAPFKTEEEVIRLSNDTTYGLAGAVFTDDVHKAIRVSNALECGQITVNMWGYNTANTPFGGYKSSGIGRDCGKEAIEGWTQVKSIKLNIFGLQS